MTTINTIEGFISAWIRRNCATVAAVRLDPHIDSDRITEDAEEYLNANNENSALWYPLVEDDL